MVLEEQKPSFSQCHHSYVLNKTETKEYFIQLWNGMLGQSAYEAMQFVFPIHICRIHVSRYVCRK